MCIVQCAKSNIYDRGLVGLNYWGKLKTLQLCSQERGNGRCILIFLWKTTLGLVSGYSLPFTSLSTRTVRKAIPSPVIHALLAVVRNARTGSLSFRGAKLFNDMPINLRSSDHWHIGGHLNPTMQWYCQWWAQEQPRATRNGMEKLTWGRGIEKCTVEGVGGDEQTDTLTQRHTERHSYRDGAHLN